MAVCAPMLGLRGAKWVHSDTEVATKNVADRRPQHLQHLFGPGVPQNCTFSPKNVPLFGCSWSYLAHFRMPEGPFYSRGRVSVSTFLLTDLPYRHHPPSQPPPTITITITVTTTTATTTIYRHHHHQCHPPSPPSPPTKELWKGLCPKMQKCCFSPNMSATQLGFSNFLPVRKELPFAGPPLKLPVPMDPSQFLWIPQ